MKPSRSPRFQSAAERRSIAPTSASGRPSARPSASSGPVWAARAASAGTWAPTSPGRTSRFPSPPHARASDLSSAGSVRAWPIAYPAHSPPQVTMRTCFFALLLAPTALAAQGAPRPISLPWRQFAEDLPRPARPAGYTSVLGRRSALIGTETGTFEAWAWPLKLLHGFEPRFKTPLYDQPVPGRDIARRVEVTA